MSYRVTLKQRVQQLKKIQGDITPTLMKAAENATMRAVEAAADATAPKKGTGREAYTGKHMLTGELKKHWSSDSLTRPRKYGDVILTELNNNMDYASYVNDGHRMDRHFVPGLYVNPNTGLLERDPTGKGGIVVGTRTKYVKGEFMVDKAKDAYRETVLAELDKEIRRLME